MGLRFGRSPIRSLLVVHEGFVKVLLHTNAVVIVPPKGIQSPGVPLVRSLPGIFQGGFHGLLYTIAIKIHFTKNPLCIGIPLVRGRKQVLQGLFVILFRIKSIVIPGA